MGPDLSVRRLTTIVAADAAGYSRLVRADEDGTLAALQAHRAELIDPQIAAHGGRIVNTAGDGLLLEFPSVVDALRFALAVQRGMRARNAGMPQDRRIEFRIGVNVGDVASVGDDLLGDGVNVAARIEALADPGGVCLSRTARDQVRDRKEFALEDLGELEVKNIERPVRVFRLKVDGTGAEPKPPRTALAARLRRAAFALACGVLLLAGLQWWEPWGRSVEAANPARMAHALPSNPSIAVLPFRNIADDADRDFFADGVSEDIITDLSKVSDLFVVSRNASFTFKGATVSARQVAEALGVRYVLEGSVRRSDDGVRINAQLIDAIAGKVIWSERYDRALGDVFAVQSEVASQVVRAMAVTLKANELDRLFQKHATNIEAYDAFVKARRIVDPPGRESIAAAQALFRKAIELDPDFAGGYAGLSFSYSSRSRLMLGASAEEDAQLALEFAQKAISVDRNFAWSYIALAGARLALGDAGAAVEAMREAVRLQPNGYEENLFLGFYLNFAGETEQAVKHLEAAQRISPIDSVRGLAFLANAYFMQGAYRKSLDLRLRRIETFPIRNPNPYIWLAATQHMLGNDAEAAAAAAKVVQLFPDFRMSRWRYFDSYVSEADRRKLYEASVRAGVPE